MSSTPHEYCMCTISTRVSRNPESVSAGTKSIIIKRLAELKTIVQQCFYHRYFGKSCRSVAHQPTGIKITVRLPIPLKISGLVSHLLLHDLPTKHNISTMLCSSCKYLMLRSVKYCKPQSTNLEWFHSNINTHMVRLCYSKNLTAQNFIRQFHVLARLAHNCTILNQYWATTSK